MREIKFRAWDEAKNEMLAWDCLMPHKGLLWSVLGKSTITRHKQQYDKEGQTEPNYIPMQFTGLKDKDGKEIFEGDIVAWNETLTGEVRWIGLNTAFNTLIHQGGWLCYVPLMCEVIGNIYENPELLGGTQKAPDLTPFSEVKNDSSD